MPPLLHTAPIAETANGGNPSELSTRRQQRHWARTRRFTALLFAAWLATTFGVVFFARELSGYTLFGWPISYYMVAQGTTLIYLAIVGIYAWRMRRLDRRYRREADDGV
jgi:putative solute:sodium symporter small subunit